MVSVYNGPMNKLPGGRLSGLLVLVIGSAFGQTEGNLLGGRVEIRGFAGANYSPSRSPSLTPRTPPSFGGQVSIAVTDMLAGIGTFAYNKGGNNPASPGIDSSIKEWMAGARISLPIRDVKVVPFASFSAGKVSFKQYAEGPPDANGVSQPTVMSNSSHAGIAPAIGADLPLTSHVGIGMEFRAVKPTDAGIYYRLTGSVFFRFP